MKLSKRQEMMATMAWTVKDLPLSEVLRLCEELTPYEPSTARAVLKAKALWDKALYANWLFPHFCQAEFGPHHLEMMDMLYPGKRGVRHAEAGPRGCAKSTVRVVFEVTHDVAYKELTDWIGQLTGDENMFGETYIIVGSETGNLARKHILTLKYEFEQNELYRALYGEMETDVLWSRNGLITDNGILIEPKSRGAQVRGSVFRGSRPSKQIWDDLQTSDGVRSGQHREVDSEWWKLDVEPAGRTDGKSNTVITGTFLHSDALLPSLVENPGYDSGVYKAVISWHDPSVDPLWEQWRNLYVDLSNAERRETARQFYKDHETKMLTGVQMLWEHLSYYQVQEAILRLGRQAVMQEYQQEASDTSGRPFDMDRAQWVRVVEERVEREDGRSVPLDRLGVSAFLDWSGTGEDGCFACVVVLLWENFAEGEEPYVYVADVWMDRGSPSDQVEAVLDLHQKWHFGKFGTEGKKNDLLTAELGDHIKRAIRERERRGGDLGFPTITWVDRKKQKDRRIQLLEPYVSNGWLQFSRELPEGFIEQFEKFPTHLYKDGPDATEGARQLRARPIPPRKRKAGKEFGVDFGLPRESNWVVRPRG